MLVVEALLLTHVDQCLKLLETRRDDADHLLQVERNGSVLCFCFLVSLQLLLHLGHQVVVGTVGVAHLQNGPNCFSLLAHIYRTLS